MKPRAIAFMFSGLLAIACGPASTGNGSNVGASSSSQVATASPTRTPEQIRTAVAQCETAEASCKRTALMDKPSRKVLAKRDAECATECNACVARARGQ